MAKILEILAKRLVFYREKKGWSQAQLADRAGVHRNTIQRYESGADGLDIEAVSKVAKALGLEETDLVYAEAPPDPIVEKHTIVDCLMALSRLFQGIKEGKVPLEYLDQLKAFAQNAVQALERASRSRGGSKDSPKE